MICCLLFRAYQRLHPSSRLLQRWMFTSQIFTENPLHFPALRRDSEAPRERGYVQEIGNRRRSLSLGRKILLQLLSTEWDDILLTDHIARHLYHSARRLHTRSLIALLSILPRLDFRNLQDQQQVLLSLLR